MFNKRFLTLLLILIFALAACGGDDSGSDEDTANTNEDPVAQTTDEADDNEATPPTATPQEEVTLEIPEGYVESEINTELLTNAFDGNLFALAEFAGRPILVQMFTLRCGSCPETQNLLRDEIIPELGTEDYVFITLSTNSSDRLQEVVAYAEEGEYSWTFARIQANTQFLLRRIFGSAGDNGAGSARFYVGPNGEISDLEVGIIDPQSAIETMRSLAETADATAGEESEMTEEAMEETAGEVTPEMTEEAEAEETPEATEES